MGGEPGVGVAMYLIEDGGRGDEVVGESKVDMASEIPR
jgi:hypothetical protein